MKQMVKRKINPEAAENLPDFFRHVPSFLIGLGTLLIAIFAADGGPNETASNPYIIIQAGFILVTIGITMILIKKILKDRSFIDRIIDVIVKIQLVILAMALIWGFLTRDSLAAALSGFLLFLEVPLVLSIIALSLAKFKQIVTFELSPFLSIAIIINWLAFAFMIINVTD